MFENVEKKFIEKDNKVVVEMDALEYQKHLEEKQEQIHRIGTMLSNVMDKSCHYELCINSIILALSDEKIENMTPHEIQQLVFSTIVRDLELSDLSEF